MHRNDNGPTRVLTERKFLVRLVTFMNIHIQQANMFRLKQTPSVPGMRFSQSNGPSMRTMEYDKGRLCGRIHTLHPVLLSTDVK